MPPSPFCAPNIYDPLGPAFSYTGSKWKLTWEGKYPPPMYDLIIETCAGSGGYSRIYHRHNVILVDRDPVIPRVWKCLQTMDERVHHLPDYFVHVPTNLEQCEQDLLGLWAARAASAPRRKMTPWAEKYPDQFWCPKVKQRLALEACYIKHWQICAASYESIWDLDIEATWFIDAPYERKPGIYRYGKMNYRDLGEFARSRRGQVIVPEGAGATWLPFKPLAPGRTKTGRPSGDTGADEVWYYQINGKAIT